MRQPSRTSLTVPLDGALSWWRMRGQDHLTFGEFVESLAHSPSKVAGVPQVVGDEAAAPPVAALEPAPFCEPTESTPEPAPFCEPTEFAPESAPVREPTEPAPEPAQCLHALPAPPWPPALPAPPWHPCLPILPGPL